MNYFASQYLLIVAFIAVKMITSAPPLRSRIDLNENIKAKLDSSNWEKYERVKNEIYGSSEGSSAATYIAEYIRTVI